MSANLIDLVERSNSFRMAYDAATRRRVFRIHCSGCKAEHDHYLQPGCAPAPAFRSARTKGWEVDDKGRHAWCPKCLKGKAKTPMDASVNAMRQQVEMVRLLDTHFDAATGAYAEPWSDAAIAKATKLAEAAVAKFREAAYGPLRSPELEEALRQIIEVRKKLEADGRAALDLIEQAKREALEKLADLEAKVQRAVAKRAA